jgi:hypoxanthine phosphoribosyltransferase
VTGPPAVVAAVRSAVRRTLTEVLAAEPDASLVLVAASGGADSTALAAALAFEAPRAGLRAGLLTVDHAWSDGSAERAAGVAAQGRNLGLDPAVVLHAPSPRQEGPAREHRRDALLGAAVTHGAAAVLLGHTLDDQAETVLLRLARGSGSRSLAGMRAVNGLLRRPLLGLRREQTREFCRVVGLDVWDDPANDDPQFLRSRVRTELLPVLTEVLGPGAVPALARSADLLRDDADALDAAADRAEAGTEALAVEGLTVDGLGRLEPAVRSRVLRRAALRAGCPPTDLSAAHIAAVDGLVTRWRGQGPLSLPGGLAATRRDGRISFVTGRAEEHPRAGLPTDPKGTSP